MAKVRRAAAAVGLVALLATACGLKVPVQVAAGQSDGDVTAVTGPGGALADGAGSELAGGTGAGGSGPGGTGGGAGGEGSTGAGGGEVAESSALFPNETEGVTQDRLQLCAHVPISGAAPVPRHKDRFGQFYWNWINDTQGGVHGRDVRLLVFDDQYYPAGARDAMEKCARAGAFLYAGAAGTDQIVSVAKWAERKKVPYFHGPTSVKDLAGFRYNVYTGPTYEYQHKLLADYLVGRFGRNVNYGMIRINSPFFEAGHDAYVERLREHGIELKVDKVVEKDESNFTDVFFELQTENVTIVNNFTTPLIWLKMLKQKPASYDPWWTVVSPGAGYNLVAQALGSGKAVVFHHFNPACECVTITEEELEQHRDLPWYDEMKRFLEVFRKYSPEQDPPPDDIDFASWLAAKATHRLLEALGPHPTRSKLWALLETWKEDPAETEPGCAGDFTRAPGMRMGAWRVNVFELDTGVWTQVETCIDRT